MAGRADSARQGATLTCCDRLRSARSLPQQSAGCVAGDALRRGRAAGTATRRERPIVEARPAGLAVRLHGGSILPPLLGCPRTCHDLHLLDPLDDGRPGRRPRRRGTGCRTHHGSRARPAARAVQCPRTVWSACCGPSSTRHVASWRQRAVKFADAKERLARLKEEASMPDHTRSQPCWCQTIRT